ncbi:MAG: GNAT family N-acetyltransferase [Acidobacteriota bacterium]|nr:GNAT family N-acetyltransferase [Blastocatellia bacterium]MDW8241351.1 GNAT family N-acetyltransferase [Acidobacteriota bacterium]
MRVHALRTVEEFQHYATFGFDVYRDNPYWTPTDPDYLVSLLSQQLPHTAEAEVQAFWVEQRDKVLAALTAVVEQGYNRHHREHLGHILFFEAMPAQDEAVQAVMQVAFRWLGERGCQAVRLSMLMGWQTPLTIDAYEAVPTVFHTYNPAYYHSYVKNAGFQTERGAVQYQIEFTPALAALYHEMVERVSRDGVRLRSFNFDHMEHETAIFTDVFNDTFSAHWGMHPLSAAMVHGLIGGLKDFLVADFIVFAELDGQTVGAVYALPDLNQAVHRMRGMSLEQHAEEFQQALSAIDHGVLLIIGVRQAYRGRGINLALAAQSYRAMIERGYTTASYTIVLDDNWPSRRTAEKLGGKVTRNFVIYRKNLA